MDTIIQFSNVNFSYEEENGNQVILDNFSLEIERGSFVCILGHNGSGKSTIARLMNGLRLPESGTVTVDGLDTADPNNEFEVKKRVGLVFQNPDNQIIATIVEDDVAFGPENIGLSANEIRKRVDEALKSVDMYERRLDAPHMLSGGQKQRVAIAGILAMQPECIVLDEPTAMLDPLGRREVLSTIKKLNKSGITVVLITHYMEEAVDCDRIIVMDNGKIIDDGTPNSIFNKFEMLKKAGLDAPQTVQLVQKLKENGFDPSGAVLSVNDCAEALTEFLRRK